MNCFPCFSSKKEDSEEDEQQLPVAQAKEAGDPLLPPQPPAGDTPTASAGESENIEARAFTFRELATATKNFRKECLVHDGGFGRVFKGTLQSSGQVMAIKQLNRNGMKGATEFIADVSTLCALKHPNLVGVIGYCADGEQRILVYEYMPLGSLESHLLDRPADKSPLDWVTRMKIASGAAEGLEYLHEKAKPPVIYGDFKSSKILLDEEYAPRLCDYGLAKLTDSGSTATVPPRVMGTYGYSAPEYARTGELTLKSDIYSFGVVLLELITGRRAIDPNRPANEQNLVNWAQPIFRDPKRFPEMVDPLLNNEFSVKSLNQVVGVAAMCLQEEPSVRPYITDVLAALSFLDFSSNDTPTPSPSMDKESEKDAADDGDRSDHESGSSSSRDSDKNENDNDENDSVANDNDEKDDNWSDKSSDHEDNGADTFSDHEDNADKNEIQENQRGSSSDHNDDDNGDNKNELHDDKSGSSTDHEDNAALTIELDNKNSSSDSEDEDYVDDDEIQQKSPWKSIKSTNSKKGKAIELSDDESLYSSGSSRSSSSSINDELGEKKTTQKVKSQRKNSVGKSSSKKSKNRWRRAKVAINHETKS